MGETTTESGKSSDFPFTEVQYSLRAGLAYEIVNNSSFNVSEFVRFSKDDFYRLETRDQREEFLVDVSEVLRNALWEVDSDEESGPQYETFKKTILGLTPERKHFCRMAIKEADVILSAVLPERDIHRLSSTNAQLMALLT